MKTIEITKDAARKYKDGFPLLSTRDFVKKVHEEDGSLIRLVVDKNFIAYAYIAKQRNSDGWILSLDEQQRIDGEFYRKLFTMAQVKRTSFYYDDKTNVFRFFNGTGDGLGGLNVDYFDGFYVFTFENQGLYYHRETIYEAFAIAINDAKGVYEKLQFNVQNEGLKRRYVQGEKAPETLEVSQNEIKFIVHLNDGDFDFNLEEQGLLEAIKNKYALQKIVLSCFSKNGAVSVAAKVGGAFKTVSVDLSTKNVEKTVNNFEVNNIDSTKQEIRAMDIMSYLDYAKKHHILFDLIVVDPPIFVRGKKGSFSLSKDYFELIKASLQDIKDGGTLILTASSASMSMKKFKQIIADAFVDADFHYEVVDTYRANNDFTVNKAFTKNSGFKAVVLDVSKGRK
ncbi:class I SAM-dependent rRNA methyltransferase [Liquorilactobacillus cacaonum]|uniref:AdoMet-dependent methyltransferase n=1 Tax=Liquorilactobacillus cacaonum DSM 21116 TaxID=1423729 RepID=A0A0R2CVB9_9LACO|nr:class I SAM-dependent rRNA methyltransferase [Liquorilactobacillus cacaonum]KRM91539.1 AdoMet-dependent methyltransferase [Liquorilactobacillus cacaonum DSM 21116]